MTSGLDSTVETGELRRYVVQLRSERGRILGTGFFVAPKWVLTCAHVLSGERNVVVAPDESISRAGLPALVDATSAPPQPGAPSSLWPFPDLALVHLAGDLEHPCALLDVEGPIAGADWQTWGFSEREQGVAPRGSPASFRYEGEEEDGYLKLKGGEAAPGLSGAPLVCPRRRAVVGVVAAARRLGSDMGGYAVPVVRLLTGDGRLPTDLTAHGSFIRAINVSAVVRDRRAWHRVLPVHGTSRILDRPWTSFVKGFGSNPSDLLRAEFGVVPYVFREAALQEAIAWCERDTPMAIARITGGGGVGKTRFALELCRLLCNRGWMAGFWRRDKASADVPLPRLVVVDYAEIEELRLALDTLSDLQSSASQIAPVRVLLLTRTGVSGHIPDPVRSEAPASLVGVLDANLDIDGASAALGTGEREELFTAAADAFATAWQSVPPDGSSLHRPELSAVRYAVPLEVLFEALDFALGGEQPAMSRFRPPAERVLDHERRYWQRTGAQFNPTLRESAAALATLAGAATDEEAHALLAILPTLRTTASKAERYRLIDWLASLYDGPGRLNPVRPDRLGEELISQILRSHEDGGQALLEGLFSLSSDSQVAHSLDTLAHLINADTASQKIGRGGYESVRAALAGCHDDLRRRTHSRRDRQEPPNAVASAYERLTEALRVVERRQVLRHREAVAKDQVADERAREEKANQEISDSLTRRDRLSDPGRTDIPAILTAADSERERLNRHIAHLEDELIAVRQARQDAEKELDRLRTERTDLDKLISLKIELEERLRVQVQYVYNEQQRRKEADELRKQAEQRGDTTQLQLENQFLRAEYEAYERRKAEDKLRDAQSRIEQLERDWDLENPGAQRERALRKEAALLKDKDQQVTQLRGQLTRLQDSRIRMIIVTTSAGVIAGAALIGILVLLIH